MPKILDIGKFRVYVYANDDNRHHLPREVLASLEAGKLEPDMGLIENIAIALGKRLRDFVGE
jgi:hypothetical protein